MKRSPNWQSRLESYITTPPSSKAEVYDRQQLQLFADGNDFDKYVTDTEALKLKHGITLTTLENIPYTLGLSIAMDNSHCKCDRCRNECSTVGKYIEHPTCCEHCVRVMFDNTYDDTEYFMRKEIGKVSMKLNENNSVSQQAKYASAFTMMVGGLVKYKDGEIK